MAIACREIARMEHVPRRSAGRTAPTRQNARAMEIAAQESVKTEFALHLLAREAAPRTTNAEHRPTAPLGFALEDSASQQLARRLRPDVETGRSVVPVTNVHPGVANPVPARPLPVQ